MGVSDGFDLSMDDEEHDGVQRSRVLGLSASNQLQVQPSLHILLHKSVTSETPPILSRVAVFVKVFLGFLNREA